LSTFVIKSRLQRGWTVRRAISTQVLKTWSRHRRVGPTKPLGNPRNQA
jgi:hypothetical protein